MSGQQDEWRERLRETAREMGASAFGVADLVALQATIPELLRHVGKDDTRAVVAGIRLQSAVLETIVDHPTPIYFHHYRQVNYQLDRMALMLADRIQDAGYRAMAVPASQIIQREPMAGHVSHKLLGWAAGIGFIGRCTLLVHPAYGAQMRYVSVLTDMPLPADAPYEGDCGTCRACIEVCPAQAVGDRREDFDLEACTRKLTEFTKLPFIGQHICGVCVRACIGRTGAARTGMPADGG
jgi:epoxyqueuosine reductase QueG